MSENSEPKLTQLKLLILSETVGNPKVFYGDETKRKGANPNIQHVPCN